MSWNYNNVNVVNAWSVAQGQGITIGVIDAGISSAQTLLGTQFNNGESNVNRTITTDYTYGNTAYTNCAHGTSMCGIAAGPRNNLGGPTGVAYKANLHFIRACADVVLDESAELLGVKNALIKMGDLTRVKIISMSIGTPFSSSVLRDGVIYANGKGKLIFAAAGTSFSWTSWWGVIYPAYYNECTAVTGVDESSNTCDNCHDGSKVRLTIPMERNANAERTTLSLPISGLNPTYVGGSSCATAFTAGVAALVWSVNPTLTSTQVYNCLKGTAQYYPILSGNRGYGNVNAFGAVTMAQGL
jgi:subtilisin family serine protease